MRAEASTGRNIRILRWAWGVGAFVLVVGLLVIVAPAVRHAGSLFDDPFVGQVQRKTVATFDASGNATGTVVTTEPAGSWLERSLGPGGVLMLRVAVVAIAAFMAGALVYRTASGTFPLEVAGVVFADKTSAGLDELTATVSTMQTRMERFRGELERVRAAGAEGVGGVADLAERLEVIEAQSRRTEAAIRGIAARLSEVAGDVDTLKADGSGRRSPKPQ
jgi:hypothetical protein